jgi:hypothetical protein
MCLKIFLSALLKTNFIRLLGTKTQVDTLYFTATGSVGS